MIKLLIIFTGLLLITPILFAEQNYESLVCWQEEIDPITDLPYNTEASWHRDHDYWSGQEPKEKPSLLELMNLYKIMKDEEPNLAKIRYDKIKHCYAGCRIAAEVNYKTSSYAAWEKEQVDLNDCKRSTHFEIKDYEASVVGADFGARELASQPACKSFCIDSFPENYRR